MRALSENGRHRDILVVTCTVSADGEHEGAQETPDVQRIRKVEVFMRLRPIK